MKKTLIGLTLLAVVATTLGACGGGEAPAGGGGSSPAMSPAASPSPKKSQVQNFELDYPCLKYTFLVFLSDIHKLIADIGERRGVQDCDVQDCGWRSPRYL